MATPDHLYKMPRMHKAFAISSIMLALSFMWMLGADYFREWRKYQATFTKLEVKKTKTDIEAAQGEVDQAKLTEIEGALTAAKSELETHKREIQDAERELGRADAVRYKVDQEYRFSKATVDSLRYEYESKRAGGSSSAPRLKEKLDAEVKQMDASHQRLFEELQKVQVIKDRISKMKEALDNAQKAHDDLYAVRDRLQKKLAKTEPSIWTLVRNAPFLDFTAPTMKVTQVVVDDLHNDVNFMEIPRIDRCVTCHVGINKPGFEDAPNPYKTHPKLELFVGGQSPHAYELFGCTTCHMGQDRATSFNEAVHWPNDEEQKKKWIHDYGWHPPEHWDEPMLARDHFEASCRKCHANQVRVPGGEKIDRAQTLIERYGCYGCHKIAGYESLPKPAPDLRSIASKVDETWAMKWLKDPRGFRPSTKMPQFWDLANTSDLEYLKRNNVEADALVALLFEKSKHATHPKPPVSGVASRGKDLVDQVGCKGCHYVGEDDPVTDRGGNRAFGPELNQVGSKLSEGWIYAWVKDPQGLSPTTRMPNLRLTDQEAADITAYLRTLRNPEFEQKSAPDVDAAMRQEMVVEWFAQKMTTEQAKAKAASMSEKEQRLYLGEKYLNRYGCYGCHLVDGFEKSQGVCVELTTWGSKYVDQLDFGFLELTETNPKHTLEAEGYGSLDKIEPTRQDWAMTKLMHPRIFDAGRVKKPDEKLKMPDYGLSAEDAKRLTTALLSFTKEKVDPRKMRHLGASGEEIEAGWRVIRNRNCVGCHKIGNEGGAISETVKKRFEKQGIGAEDAEALAVSYSPPNLLGEGGKVHPDWFFRFLKGPTTIRPWLPLRMPTFGLDDADANAIIGHFARSDGGTYPFKYRPVHPMSATDNASAVKLMSKDYFDCFNCHMQGTKKPEGPPSGWAPDLTLARQRLQPDWIVKWLHDPQKLQPGTKMPTFYDPADPKSSAPQDVLGGDPDTQIETLKNHVISLGRPYAGE